MAKENPEQNLSTEVIGQLSDEQRVELSTLGLAIIEARKLDPKNPENVAQVQAILEDCVYRGLDLQHRPWFSKKEKVTPIFQLGLGQRQGVVERLARYRNDDQVLQILDRSELVQTSNISPFSPNFEEIEQTLPRVEERLKTVNQLHEQLFSNPLLADEAKKLRNLVRIQGTISLVINTSALLEYQKNKMLYANFLVNLALFQQAGVTVEVEDIAAIADLWDEDTNRARSQNGLVKKMGSLANQMGLSTEAVEIYTQNVIEIMNLELLNKDITLEGLKTTDIFAVSTSDLQAKDEEIELKEEGEIIVVQEDVDEAKKALNKLLESYLQLMSLPEDKANEYHDAVFQPFFQELTPLEVAFLLGDINNYDGTKKPIRKGKRKMEVTNFVLRDLAESAIPFRTLVETLSLLSAMSIKIAESGKKLEIMDATTRQRINQQLTSHILEYLLEQQDLPELMPILPINLIERLIDNIKPSSLPNNQLKLFLGLDPNVWIRLSLEKGITVETFLAQKGQIIFDFPEGSQAFKAYFDRLPENVRLEIAKRLKHVVDF